MLFKKRRATVSPFLIGLPLMMMIASIGLANNDLQGVNANVQVCNANNLNQGGSCQTATGSTTYTCPSVQQLFVVPCGIYGPNIPPNNNRLALKCPPTPPPPSYCSITGNWLLPAGTSVTINNNVTQAESSQSFFLGIGTIGPSGFIFIFALVISIFILAGLTIFGTGQSFESLHILFMGGLMMAIWLLLSTLDGVVTHSPSSMFSQLDASFSMDGLPVGTSLYVALTFLYLIGFIGMVKRGG